MSPVAAAGSISGATYSAARTSAVAAVQMPGQPWLEYTPVGTAISYGSTGGQLRNLVLGPGRNPYGTTNAQGVYVIDAGGRTDGAQS